MVSNKHDGRGGQVQSVGSRYASHDLNIECSQRGLLRKIIILCPICLLLYPSAPSHKYLNSYCSSIALPSSLIG
jgi:hypothetical protein